MTRRSPGRRSPRRCPCVVRWLPLLDPSACVVADPVVADRARQAHRECGAAARAGDAAGGTDAESEDPGEHLGVDTDRASGRHVRVVDLGPDQVAESVAVDDVDREGRADRDGGCRALSRRGERDRDGASARGDLGVVPRVDGHAARVSTCCCAPSRSRRRRCRSRSPSPAPAAAIAAALTASQGRGKRARHGERLDAGT